jgi:ferric-dicitrate binding protein FerR (iron transport regulator)
MPSNLQMLDKTKQFEKLMMQYLSETISDNDKRVLADILNSDPNYKARYNEMVKTRAISLIPVIEAHKTSNYKQFILLLNNGLTFSSQPKFVQYFIRIAAIIIFAFTTSVSSFYFYNEFKSQDNIMSYETIVPHGSQSKIVLPDGSIAWLNSGSILKYNTNYGNKNRTVYLTGEGYFDVQKDPKKPFFVYANDIKVKVLGTVFNVRSYIDEATVEVNLIEGKVDVMLENNAKNEKLTLLPNNKVVYDKTSKKMQSFKSNAARAATWTTGKLCFVDASFEEISKDLERKYDVQISIQTQKIKNELFSGSLDLNQPIEKVLEYIDVDKKYDRTYNGKVISISNLNELKP